MVKLRCTCLNVSVDTVGCNLREAEGSIFISDGITDGFFGDNIYEVQLAVGGIRKELEFLMRSRQVGDWVVYKCLGCNTEPVAIHAVKGEQRVLVSKSIQRDPEKIASLVQSSNISPAFKIVLNLTREDDLDTNNRYSNQSINTSSTVVQEHVKRFLKSEEEMMEERIREYTVQQRSEFAAVQTRAFNDKKAMLSILRKAAESKVEECLSDAMDDVRLETLSDDVDRERHNALPGFPHSDVTNIEIVRPSATTTCNTHNKKDKSEFDGDHFDPMFQNDHDCPAFADSDEEDASDNSFNQREDYRKARYSRVTENASRYSSSVPVNVPFMRNTVRSSYTRMSDEEDLLEVPSPDKMAESIQALARSVQDSRTIFGDLPRPRVNTLPVNFT